jgi:hypothetical protein
MSDLLITQQDISDFRPVPRWIIAKLARDRHATSLTCFRNSRGNVTGSGSEPILQSDPDTYHWWEVRTGIQLRLRKGIQRGGKDRKWIKLIQRTSALDQGGADIVSISQLIRAFILSNQHMFSVVIRSTKQNIISSFASQATQSSVNMGSVDKGMKTELTQYSHRRSNIGPYADDLDVDVIIVGGGFGMHYTSTTSMARKTHINLRWCFLSQNTQRAWSSGSHL